MGKFRDSFAFCLQTVFIAIFYYRLAQCTIRNPQSLKMEWQLRIEILILFFFFRCYCIFAFCVSLSLSLVFCMKNSSSKLLCSRRIYNAERIIQESSVSFVRFNQLVSYSSTQIFVDIFRKKLKFKLQISKFKHFKDSKWWNYWCSLHCWPL